MREDVTYVMSPLIGWDLSVIWDRDIEQVLENLIAETVGMILRGSSYPMPDGPGLIKLSVWQVNYDKIFLKILRDWFENRKIIKLQQVNILNTSSPVLALGLF